MLSSKRFENLATLLPGLARPEGVVIGGREPERPDHIVETGANRGIRDSELRFDILDDSTILDEDLEKTELVAIEASESIEPECAIDSRSAMAALETGDVKLEPADRALARSGVSTVMAVHAISGFGHVSNSLDATRHLFVAGRCNNVVDGPAQARR